MTSIQTTHRAESVSRPVVTPDCGENTRNVGSTAKHHNVSHVSHVSHVLLLVHFLVLTPTEHVQSWFRWPTSSTTAYRLYTGITGCKSLLIKVYKYPPPMDQTLDRLTSLS